MGSFCISSSFLILAICATLASSILMEGNVLEYQYQQRQHQKKQPSIIFFLVDDMGFMDFSWRDPRLHTPHLQRLRDEGVELNQMYMLPKCTASRAALMTGRYPYKHGLQSNTVFRHCRNNTLPVEMKTLPQYLKDLGYSTHAVGKWHLGFCKLDYTPSHRGFDTFYGSYMGSIDNYKLTFTKGEGGFDFHYNEVPHWPSQGHYTTTLLTSRTQFIIREHVQAARDGVNGMKVLGQNPNAPLFIYLAYTAVHDPIQSPQHYIRNTACRRIRDAERRKYCGMLAAVDESVGNITNTLRQLGVEDDYLLLFASDNGGSWAHGSSNWPLRGHKGTVFEGGTRVAGFMHGPKFLPRSPYLYNGVLHGIDILPTLVGAAGGKVTDDIDGLDSWGPLQQNERSGRREMVYNLDTQGQLGALRQIDQHSDFKLVYDRTESAEGGCSGWMGQPPEAPRKPRSVPCPDYMLFDLANDPEENHNVALQYPEVFQRLKERYLELKQEEVFMPNYTLFQPMCQSEIYHGAWTHGWC